MKKLTLLLSLFLIPYLVVLLVATKSIPQIIIDAGRIIIAEIDGSPTTRPWKIKFSNASVTDNADGTVTVVTGGTGNVSGPGSSTDGYIPLWVGTTGTSLGVGTSISANGKSLVGAADYAAMKALLDLEIGTDIQAYDADLTTYAGITPSANVQTLLGLANYAAIRTTLGLAIGTNVQAYDADLTTYAGITPSSNVQTMLGLANYAAIRTTLGLAIGTNVQAYDSDLSTYAGITPSANVQTILNAATYAAVRSSLGLVIGTDVQAQDAELAAIAGLTFADVSIVELTGASAAGVVTSGGGNRILGANAGNTALEFKSSLTGLTFGGFTASRGIVSDASGNLVVSAASDTEIGYVDGVTSAIQTQLDLKSPLASPTFTGTVTFPTPFTLGATSVTPTGTELNYVDGVTSAIQTQLNAKSPASKSFTITGAVATSDYALWRSANAITITAVHCIAIGGTNVIGQLAECDANGATCVAVDASDITCTATNANDDGALSNASIDATDYVGWITTSVSGTNTYLTVTFEFTTP